MKGYLSLNRATRTSILSGIRGWLKRGEQRGPTPPNPTERRDCPSQQAEIPGSRCSTYCPRLLGNSQFQHVATAGWWYIPNPLKNYGVRQLGLLFPIYGKIKNFPDHQPELEETTKFEHSCSITLKTDRIRQITHLHSAESQEKKILGDICNGYVLDMCALRLYHTVSISNMSECLNIGDFPKFSLYLKVWPCFFVLYMVFPNSAMFGSNRTTCMSIVFQSWVYGTGSD